MTTPYAQYDAWLVKPPCMLTSEPYCYPDCPYFHDCQGDESDFDNDDIDSEAYDTL